MYISRPTVYLNTVKARFFKGNACNGHHSALTSQYLVTWTLYLVPVN